MMFPGLLLIASAILAWKNKLFKLSWAPGTSFFLSVSAISARKKKQSITWNAGISANNRSIWTNIFSLAPQRTGEQDMSCWTDQVIVKVGYGRFRKCADLYCTPGISPSVFWPEKSYLFWSALPPLWFRVRTRLWFPASWFCWLPFPLHDRPHVGPDAIMFKHHQCIRRLLWQFTHTWRHVLFETKVGTILVAILHTFLGERWHFSTGISWTNFPK